MKKNYKYGIIALSLIIACSINTNAQELKPCHSSEVNQEMRDLHPEILKIEEELEKFTQEFSQNKARTAGTVYTIPVVFHILHENGTENISDAQINDAVRILNEDFRKLNSDTSTIVSAFKGIAADSEMEFKLAQKDPNGNCTNGIDRIFSSETNEGTNDSKLNPWSRSKYLNVWVVKAISSGAAGYAYKPGAASGLPTKDGIMILNNYVGSIGTGNLSRSRALTHEIGHWINLDHTWGGTNQPGCDGTSTNTSDPCYGIDNCDSDDAVADTPNSIGWTTCNLSGTTCGSLDNVQNFMDYSYCSRMFTEGQKTRMRAALNSTTAQRNNLWTATNLTATGTNGTNILCVADFKSVKTFICEGSSIIMTDASYNVPTTWEWSFPGGTPSTSNVQNPTVTYNTAGTYSVTLTVTNSSGTKTITKTNYMVVHPAATMYSNSVYTEGWETATSLPNSDWTVLNPTGGNTWTRVTGVGASGNASAKITNNSSMVTQVDELISPSYNFTTISNPVLTYKAAYAQQSSASLDKLQVYVTTNCGSTWLARLTRSGANLSSTGGTYVASNFTPTSTQWKQETVSLASFVGATNARIKFVFTSDGGNNVYIDDINIEGPLSVNQDLASELNLSVYPNPAIGGSSVYFNLTNKSDVTVAIYDLLGKEIQQVINTVLQAGEQKVDFNAAAGMYTVKVTINGQPIIRKVVIE